MNSPRLVLFDIDGTLISTNGIARTCFAEAMESVLGTSTIAKSHDFAGKTDLQIYTEVMLGSGREAKELEMHRHAIFSKFFTLLESRLSPKDITVLPGIRELLDTLTSMPSITLALLTGNMEMGARIKLTPVNLYQYFSFGAFGCDSMHREDLPAIAVQRAYVKTGLEFRGKNVVIIGDTRHDITCGRGIGARSIAVATGGTPLTELWKYQPDFVFPDASTHSDLIDAILS